MPARRQEWEHGTIFGYAKRQCRCDACRRAKHDYDQARYARLREKRAEQNREWRDANREKVNGYNRAAYYRNLDGSRERNRVYGASEQGREQQRVRQARYQATDKGRLKNASEQAKRRGLVVDEWTNEYIAILLKDPCSCCGGAGGSIDHIVPVSKGGTSEWDNLAAACLSCNASKNNQDLLGFLSRKVSA